MMMHIADLARLALIKKKREDAAKAKGAQGGAAPAPAGRGGRA